MSGGIRGDAAQLRIRDIFGGPRGNGGAKGEAQSRRVSLDGVDVDYRFFRVRRRTIGMEIGVTGLTVRAPRWISLRDVEDVLRERSVWILRTLEEWANRRRDVLPSEWKTGAPILYLGRELALAVRPARGLRIEVDLLNLTVLHPAHDDESQVAHSVTHWLRDETLRLFAPRAIEFAAKIGARAPTVKLSNARSEWGSCNHQGVIRLNWRLAQLPFELALYVVAHEVAHLVELNHSSQFWSVAEKLFPGSLDARRTLDDWTALLDA
jgi:predicted metal-dependent hydrolase